MVNTKKISLTLGIIAVAAWAVNANASLINVGDHLSISGTINGSLADTGYVNNGQGGSSYENVYSGVFSVNVVNQSQLNNTFNIGTFCTDVGVNWTDGPNAYRAFSFASATGVNPTWSTVPAAIQNASYLYNQYYIPAANAHTLTADQAAGLQLAIWKALYDTGGSGSIANASFASGNLLAYGFGTTAMNDAAGYVSDINSARGSSWDFTQYTDTWLAPVNGSGTITPISQGLIWNNTTPVPEPTTMIAGALLLLPFGASTLRFMRKNRSA